MRLDVIEKSDRYFLLHQARELGPIFKGIAWDRLWVCMVGIERCRRFLHEHADDLKPVTLQLNDMFPKGFLRQMRGAAHRDYRKKLLAGIAPEDIAAHQRDLSTIAADGLRNFFDSQDTDATNSAYYAALNGVASGMLVQLFFGVNYGTDAFERLMGAYKRLGPFGLVWNLGDQQRSAFAEIRDLLREQVSAGSRYGSRRTDCIIDRIADDDALDETLLGNLIYMVEMGRYDMSGLFRWMTKYGAEHPALLRRIAEESKRDGGTTKSLAEAFVLETLRTDQSERLVREARKNLVFENFLIPKSTMVRCCLWESHKSDNAFENPFDFNPERFLKQSFTSDQYSPFGLDHHRCPLGDMAIRTSKIFLRALARYDVEATADGLPARGAYHWEPSPKFAVRLHPR